LNIVKIKKLSRTKHTASSLLQVGRPICQPFGEIKTKKQPVYISKLFAKNFRSLRQAVVRLENGKNVIVGKNNSGKSNIIKALELLVGEKHPSYATISQNDFYTYKCKDDEGNLVEKVADDFYIEIELQGRDFNESEIKSMKKSAAFSKIGNISDVYKKEENEDIWVNFDFFQSLDDIENRPEIVKITETSKAGKPYETKVKWFNGEGLYQKVSTAKVIKIFLSKSRIDEDASGYGIIIIDSDNNFWVSHYMPKKFRDSIITTTVISALRSHKEDLRLNQYTWFGKLIGALWNANKTKVEPQSKKSYEELIREKSENIRVFVDAVFEENTIEMRKLLESAIAHNAVSFKFLSNSKFDLYKNVQIFVDDGIDRPINEKGTGIQSAVIIALFSQYCYRFHNSSSLLITEEPELYLHPQARRVISAELNNYIKSSKEQKRQLIISTHSTEYLRNVEPKNIIRVFKDDNLNCSVIAQLSDEVASEITKEIQRFIWSANTEMFFADKVILVEGGELYLLPALVDKILSKNQLLDYENTTVARVNGKGNFLTYLKMLHQFKIEWIVLGDLDCFRGEVRKICKHLSINEYDNEIEAITTKINASVTDFEGIKDRVDKIERNLDVQGLQNVFERFENGTIERDDEDLQKTLVYIRSRYIKVDIRNAIIEAIGIEKFTEMQKKLRNSNIFIWSFGELENYYSKNAKLLRGSKDMKALELSYLVAEENSTLENWFENVDEINELIQRIAKNKKSLNNVLNDHAAQAQPAEPTQGGTA